MTLLDHGQPADTTTKKNHTGLIAVLAVLAVALLAAGAWLIVDRQQQPLSAEEQQAAIMEVVTAHRDALEARDQDAILATLTDDATALYLLSKPGDPTPLSRDDYAGLVAGWGGDKLTFVDDPVFFDDPPQVAARTRVEYPGLMVNDEPAEPRVGSYIFTLREVEGQLKIASIVFTEDGGSFGVGSGSAA
jgi:hypothetical protein